jgi:replicative superfamily II helicase
MLRGLFIGVDRHSSPSINWLSCACRDAKALHGLFTDTLGGQTALLIDGQATRASIERAVQELSGASDDDIVVITFSGHGTETHELVAYDADLADTATTCIPLETLGAWLHQIPARNLILVLDCCFSGGIGSKGLEIEAHPRDLSSTESRLQELSGKGRLILTASSATEPAWESAKYGHGFLSFYLLEALQGPSEVMDGNKLSVYRVLDYVTKRVVDSAAAIGKVQSPALRGSIDGELGWPVFMAGKEYFAAFPERKAPPVTADVQSLANYGFPGEIVSAWAGSIPSLNRLQIEAVNDYGLLRGEHLVVSAPTSSGKTLIGELAAVYGALQRKRALFLFPLKALANDKARYFNQIYGTFGLRTIRVTGDSTSDEILPFMRGQYDICLMTYEKCAAMLLANPYLLEQVGTIVVDEVQMIADASRGINLEFLLTMLRLRRRTGVEPLMIALSAVIGDTKGFERWLGARLLRKTERPVPLDEGVVRADGRFRYVDGVSADEKTLSAYIAPEWRKGSSQDLVIPLVKKLIAEGKSVIVFRETKGLVRGCARYLAQTLGLPPATAALAALPAGDVSVALQDLRADLQGGVGFHNADLAPDERQVIEEEFRVAKELRVLAATTTLAMGVNTPAEAVVVVGLMHPGDTPYSVAEYKNIVGRAGRLGFAAHGTSYLVAMTPNDEHYYWNRYVKGSPESIQSQFLQADSDVRSLILRVLVTAEQSRSGMRADDIILFLEESFAVFLQKQLTPGWRWDRPALDSGLNDLVQHKMVEADQNGLFHLTALGRLAGVAGTEVESVIRVVGALQSVAPAEITDPTLIVATQLTVELDAILFPINRKSTQKEPQAWIGELRNQGIPYGVLNSLERSVDDHHQPTLRAKKAAACLMWISGMQMADIERRATQFGGGFDAAGPMRSVKSRTCDLLPTVARIAELLYGELVLGERVERLLTRLEIGIPSVAVTLAQIAGDRLSRGDYLRMVSADIAAPDNAAAVSDDVLLNCLDQSKPKLGVVRSALTTYQAKGAPTKEVTPLVPPYKA